VGIVIICLDYRLVGLPKLPPRHVQHFFDRKTVAPELGRRREGEALKQRLPRLFQLAVFQQSLAKQVVRLDTRPAEAHSLTRISLYLSPPAEAKNQIRIGHDGISTGQSSRGLRAHAFGTVHASGCKGGAGFGSLHVSGCKGSAVWSLGVRVLVPFKFLVAKGTVSQQEVGTRCSIDSLREGFCGLLPFAFTKK